MAVPPIRVLLVEDDEDDYVLTRDLLEEIEQQPYLLEWVSTFEAGQEALAAKRHDVALIDYRLGARHGLELIERAIAKGHNAPLILLTGQSEAEIDRLAMVAGAADYLVKGEITPPLLERAIRYAIERARNVEVLKRAEQNFRSLIERAPDAIAVERDGRFVYANPGMVKLLGAGSLGEVLGRSVWDFVHPDDRPGTGAAADGPRRELRLARDPRVVVDVSSLALKFDGAPAVVIFARDVSEAKRMQERLLLADRLASVGTLAAGAAHEINNPLAALIASLACILDEIDRLENRLQQGPVGEAEVLSSVASVREIVLEADEAAQRVRRIVEDLKKVSRRETTAANRVFDLRDVLESALSVVGNDVRRRARLVRQCESTPPVVGNEAQLGQVFVNLLLNAAQAIPEGAPNDNAVTVATRTDDDGSAIVEVRDTGTGIPPEAIQRLFDPFYTTKPVGTGTGLGLSVCHGIVTSLGGRIEVESKVGRGSVFRVVLPPAPPACDLA